jgi:hypothetical protein
MKMVFPDPADVLNFTLALTPDEGEWGAGGAAKRRRCPVAGAVFLAARS